MAFWFLDCDSLIILQQAFYNWAIAISDRAKARGRTKEAEELWKEVVLVIVCNLVKVQKVFCICII